MRRFVPFLLIALTSLSASVTLTGCHTSRACGEADSNPPPDAKRPSHATEVVAEQSVMAVLWYQRAAECRALCFQACNIARERIDQHLARTHPRPSAIIVDIDETVLDNSAYQAGLARRGQTYSEATWTNWVNFARAQALPGISNLFSYAASKKVEVFYISSRKAFQTRQTITNLQEQGLPFADEKHVLLRTDKESKDDRRGPLMTNGVYDIVLLMGDNLADFHHDFESTNQLERLEFTERDRAAFGNSYIVLPNPMYGGWEGALYDVKTTPDRKKLFLRNRALRVFNPDRRAVEE